MKAVYLTGPNVFSVQERESPVRKRNEVEIRVRMAGICGSDLHILRGRIPFAVYPMIPGHEYMGEVLRAPAGSALKAGDRVTVFPGVGCGRCAACREGRIVHCQAFRFAGSTLPEGGFCERVVAPPDRVILLPRGMSDEAGAMVEPAAVAVHVNRRAAVAKGMKVAVIGGGVIGLLIAQVARVLGASRVVLSEPMAERRKTAGRLGFRLVCDPAREDLPSFVKKAVGHADAVFDVVATPKTIRDGQAMLLPGGKLVLVGFPHDREQSIPYMPILAKEMEVIGCRTYFKRDFPEAIRLLRQGKIDWKAMISRVFPLEDFPEAVRCLEEEPGRHMKVLIRLGD